MTELHLDADEWRAILTALRQTSAREARVYSEYLDQIALKIEIGLLPHAAESA